MATIRMHPGIGLAYIESMVKLGNSGGFDPDVTREEALAAIAEQRAKGYTYWPADCGSLRPDGHCAGHPVRKEVSA